MGFLSRFNPLRAVGDLRRYLASRQPYEIIFLFAALAVMILILGFFAIGTRVDRPHQAPDIIYVQSWRADRTDAEIIAQQKIDEAKKKADQAKLDKLREQNRQEFQRVKDRFDKWL